MQAFCFFCRKSGTKPCGICRKSGGKNSILCAMPIPFFILRRSINHPILKGICIVLKNNVITLRFSKNMLTFAIEFGIMRRNDYDREKNCCQ